MLTRGEHANPTQKGPSWDSNQDFSCFEATVLTTTPSCSPSGSPINAKSNIHVSYSAFIYQSSFREGLAYCSEATPNHIQHVSQQRGCIVSVKVLNGLACSPDLYYETKSMTKLCPNRWAADKMLSGLQQLTSWLAIASRVLWCNHSAKHANFALFKLIMLIIKTIQLTILV